MSDDKYTVNDIANGSEVANVMANFYLNSFESSHPDFMWLMLQEKRNMKHNFTILCVKWFIALAKVEYFDDRNADSVAMAREIDESMTYEPLECTPLSRKKAPRQMTVNYRDGAEIHQLITAYLRLSDNHKTFIGYMLQAHKTLQQNFSRFCLEWFESVVQNEKQNTGFVRIAGKANRYRRNLRYI